MWWEAVRGVAREILVHCTAGLPDAADKVLNSPETFAGDAVIENWNAAKRANNGSSLSLAEMKQLADDAVERSSVAHPIEVGGPHQVAVIHAGKTISFEHPVSTFMNFKAARFARIDGGYVGQPVLHRNAIPDGIGFKVADLVATGDVIFATNLTEENEYQSLDHVFFAAYNVQELRLTVLWFTGHVIR